jgi:hypothetical protein
MLIERAAACRGSKPIPLLIPYGDKSIFRDSVDSGGKLHFRDLPVRGGDPPFLRIRRAANLVVPCPLCFAKLGVFTTIVSRTQFCATFARPTASIDIAWGGFIAYT